MITVRKPSRPAREVAVVCFGTAIGAAVAAALLLILAPGKWPFLALAGFYAYGAAAAAVLAFYAGGATADQYPTPQQPAVPPAAPPAPAAARPAGPAYLDDKRQAAITAYLERNPEAGQ